MISCHSLVLNGALGHQRDAVVAVLNGNSVVAVQVDVSHGILVSYL